MPIFEYRCEDCEAEFEKLVLAGPSDPVRCPTCGGTRASRLVSTFGFARAGANASGGAAASCCASGGCSCRH